MMSISLDLLQGSLTRHLVNLLFFVFCCDCPGIIKTATPTAANTAVGVAVPCRTDRIPTSTGKIYGFSARFFSSMYAPYRKPPCPGRLGAHRFCTLASIHGVENPVFCSSPATSNFHGHRRLSCCLPSMRRYKNTAFCGRSFSKPKFPFIFILSCIIQKNRCKIEKNILLHAKTASCNIFKNPLCGIPSSPSYNSLAS